LLLTNQARPCAAALFLSSPQRRGLYRGLLDAIMSVDGVVSYSLLSPLAAARGLAACAGAAVGRFLPPALLLHGTGDITVPSDGSRSMAAALRGLGVSCPLGPGVEAPLG
jgi:acetyl esterase/lipase